MTPDRRVALINEALDDVQQYLADQKPPLLVAASVDLLVKRVPPDELAANIQSWVGLQYHGSGPSLPVSDYLFHAMKKLHILGDIDLVDRTALAGFLERLAPQLIAFCPETDRELLSENISRLGKMRGGVHAPIEHVHRQMETEAAMGKTRAGAPGAVPAAPVLPPLPFDVAAIEGLRSFGLLLNRLQSNPDALRNTTSPEAQGTVAQLLLLALLHSKDWDDIESHFSNLKELGIEKTSTEVFRELAQALPDWALPANDPLFNTAAALRPIQAMQRMISLTEDKGLRTLRLRELVNVAIEEFNKGSLTRAAAMFELAEVAVRDLELDNKQVQLMKERSHEALEQDVLRKAAEDPEKHMFLQKILGFFDQFTPQELISSLEGETKRDRRRLLLTMLEGQGLASRTAASEQLPIALSQSSRDFYLLRNLVYLLRKIPPAEGTDLSQEIGLISALAGSDPPIFLMKELVAYLSSLRHEAAEEALTLLAGRIERTLLRPTPQQKYEPGELLQILDRVVNALGRIGTLSAVRGVVEHALKREAPLGDTMARLTVLGTQNFAGDPETVTKLVETLRAELPTKVLGFTVKGNPQNVFYLIEAIGGTPAPAVSHLLEELVTRFKETEIGKAAARAMGELGSKPLAVAEHQRSVSLFGDLELFGLPKLLQTLSESKASGLLTIKTLDNELAGVVVFHEGGMLDAQAGRIRGESAVYQLFERPVPGTFTFHAKKDPPPDQQGKKPMAVLPIIIEAMQRFDALGEVRILVPDEVRFKATGARPTPHPDEQDGTFIRALWERVGSGATAVGCEQDMASDAYRVRRLLHHWVNQGALHPV